MKLQYCAIRQQSARSISRTCTDKIGAMYLTAPRMSSIGGGWRRRKIAQSWAGALRIQSVAPGGEPSQILKLLLQYIAFEQYWRVPMHEERLEIPSQGPTPCGPRNVMQGTTPSLSAITINISKQLTTSYAIHQSNQFSPLNSSKTVVDWGQDVRKASDRVYTW